MPVYRGKTLRLVPRLSRRRQIADVGSPELPLERLRFRGQRPGRHCHRLAHPLRGHRAVVRLCGDFRGHQRLAGRLAATARRQIPAAHGNEYRRKGRGGPPQGKIRKSPHDYRSRGQPDGTAQRARQLPVPQPVQPRLPVRRLFQHAIGHFARRRRHRQPHAATLLHRQPDFIRQG